MSKITSLDSLAGELENAPVAAQPGAPNPAGYGDGPPDGPPDDPGPQDDGQFGGRPHGQIFEGCPVRPLGVYGDVNFYLDVQGQLRALDNHTRDKIRHVFGGRVHLLAQHFPVYNKDQTPKRNAFNHDGIAAAMCAACDELGVWSPTGKVRGPGFWADDEGGLVIHAGNEVLIGGEWRKPGVYGGRVYAAGDAIPRPAETLPRKCPATALLDRLQTWNWRRPDIDPMISLGLVMAQMCGGALEWRPVAWLTGDAATGKSTFQKLLLHVHGGPDGLLQAADATEAGIRSVLGFSSLPVAIDELEPDPDRPQKTKAVVELARRAASGAQIFRGSTDQKGYQSNAYSCFLFSSILVPDMPSQDRSRLILLDLDRLPEDAPKLAQDPRQMRALGEALRRLIVDRWASWPERLELWRAALAKEGQTGRGADNYGTVLALADMALNDALPSADTLANWAKKLGHAITEESIEVGSNAEDMLSFIMGQYYDVYRRGEQWTVGQWVQAAAKLPHAPRALMGDGSEGGKIEAAQAANEALAKIGLRVGGSSAEPELFFPNKAMPGLCRLFQDSPWANGVWSQAAKRVAGSHAAPNPLRLAGTATRGVWVPLASIAGILDFPTTSQTHSSSAAQCPNPLDDFAPDIPI